MNKFMKTSYASPVQLRFVMASYLDERNSSRRGSGCFEVCKSGGSSLKEIISELYSPVLTD